MYVAFVVSGPIWIINLRHRLINNPGSGPSCIYTYTYILHALSPNDKYLTGLVYGTQMRDDNNNTGSIGGEKEKLSEELIIIILLEVQIY